MVVVQQSSTCPSGALPCHIRPSGSLSWTTPDCPNSIHLRLSLPRPIPPHPFPPPPSSATLGRGPVGDGVSATAARYPFPVEGGNRGGRATLLFCQRGRVNAFEQLQQGLAQGNQPRPSRSAFQDSSPSPAGSEDGGESSGGEEGGGGEPSPHPPAASPSPEAMRIKEEDTGDSLSTSKNPPSTSVSAPEFVTVMTAARPQFISAARVMATAGIPGVSPTPGVLYQTAQGMVYAATSPSAGSQPATTSSIQLANGLPQAQTNGARAQQFIRIPVPCIPLTANQQQEVTNFSKSRK
ncbi:hypothetical protein J437_LFUL004534 [Ladona fulva]|uniref:Uncharacterized protein n=1 Tax=Ladona fulva TaxID=123851 RepID=A0A8K0KA80_LADFU|nr:hypothetical protein J437_LFUL004534 [Ladona fulva]